MSAHPISTDAGNPRKNRNISEIKEEVDYLELKNRINMKQNNQSYP